MLQKVIPRLIEMLKWKLLLRTFTYLGWEKWGIKYQGNQIESLTHIHINTNTHTHTHTFGNLPWGFRLDNLYKWHATGIYYRYYRKCQRHNTTFIFIKKFTWFSELCEFMWKRRNLDQAKGQRSSSSRPTKTFIFNC